VRSTVGVRPLLMPAHDYEFAAPVLRRDDGLRFHYLPLPGDVAEALDAAGLRVLIATFNGRPFRRAVQGRRDGERYLLVGQAMLREIGAGYGDVVEVALRPDPDSGRVKLGEELEAVLEQDEGAAARFYGMTPGRQRSLAYYVASAKRPETRVKRALALAHKLRTHTLYGDLHPER
jgi:hypothetical protein